MLTILATLGLGLANPAVAQDTPDIPFEKYELENGLDVILAPDSSTPIVYVSVWYHVGSKDETEGLTGFAHLFEHLMFQGSLSLDGEYFEPLLKVGASINGTTNADRTNYYEGVPAHHLPLALFLESDRMGSLLPVLSQDKLDEQREVVKNERRQRYENPPYGEAYKDVSEALFPESHPYHHMTIGSHEDLTNASLDDVKNFFKKWYVPNNAAIVIAGDFDEATAKRLVLENFSGIPRGADPKHAEVAAPSLAENVVLRQEDDVPEDRFWMAWHTPALYAPGDAELDVLSTLLSSGKDSRLYQRIVKEKKLARSVYAGQYSGYLSSRYMIGGTPAEGHTTDEVIAEVMAMIEEVTGDKPPTEEEITTAKTNYERQFFDRIQTIQGKGELLQNYNMYHGDPGYIGQDLARYRAVTAEGVVEAAKNTFSKPHVELHITKKTEGGE